MHGKPNMCDSLSVGAFLLSHSYTSQFVMVSHIMDGLHSRVAFMAQHTCNAALINGVTVINALILSVFSHTIHTTHSEPTLLEFYQAIESATTPSLNMGHKI